MASVKLWPLLPLSGSIPKDELGRLVMSLMTSDKADHLTAETNGKPPTGSTSYLIERLFREVRVSRKSSSGGFFFSSSSSNYNSTMFSL